MDDEGRTLPNDEGAEKSYVSNILQSETCLDDAIEDGAQRWIFDEGLQAVIAACFELREHSEPVDITTVASKMLEHKTLEKFGPALLADIIGQSPTIAHQNHYGQVVRGNWLKRTVICTLEKQIDAAYDESTLGDLLIDGVETDVLAIREECEMKDGSLESSKDVVMSLVDNIEAAQIRGGGLAGFPTGLVGLDEMTSGFQPGNLVLIPARPSQGKTALLVSLLSGLIDTEVPCAMFTLEMQSKEIMRRFICLKTGVAYKKLLEGGLSQVELANIMRASGEMADASFILDDTPALTLGQFRSRCRRLARQGVKVIGVDYIQLMRNYTKRSKENRQVEIADISAGIKSTLKECEMTGLVLAQLNRDVDKTARKPRLSDIRESGALEQDCDICACIYRPHKDSEDYIDENVEPCELILLKNRNGPTGSIKMNFDKNRMRFKQDH